MQKKLSMFQIILLAVFASLAIAGVLIFALATAGGQGGGVGAVTIWGTLDPTAMQAIIRNAAETDPRLSQVTYVQKDPAAYQADLSGALASGTGPDIFIITQDWAMHDASMAYTLPPSSISPTQFTSTFVQSALPFLSDNGVVAIPLLADPLALYWDRDMVASAGFAQPVRYWDELPTQAQAITKKDDSGSIVKSAVDFGGYQNVDNAKDILATLILQAGGLITARDNTGHFVPAIAGHAGSAAQATNSALNFFTDFADPSKPDYSWSKALPDARQAFAAQQLAYYIGYASEEPLIKQMNPNLNYAVAGMPQLRTAKASINFAKVYGLAVSKQSQNQAGALTVALLLASAQVSGQLSVAYGIPSARLDVLSQVQPGKGNDDLYAKMAIISRAWVDPDPSQTGPIFQTMVEDTTSGAASVSDAVLRADQTLGHILGL
jgi:ABC-type glycerol-3-phosphate transport system substrate-binding protein